MNVDPLNAETFGQDFFTLFDLPRAFALDAPLLDERYRAAAGEVHPDRFARAGDAERRVALMMATRVNEAYRTLKQPLSRARYLLTLHGVDTQEETNTAMPAAFLMAQMEWREAVMDAKADRDVDALERLARELRGDASALTAELQTALDTAGDLDAAALLVRKWRFLEKLEQEIGDAIEALLF
ncbi:Fe-S protein assembly co-chaperone HscB [Crenobacter cavernae]|uniref:Co-chaperone protein HscB homolog n=1 Tax=Crenobacter cavernae TaxID=2290923 RepID=A0A345Y6G6_9NEIS|nr:Fe-S protein assembly co-chaperone HscB [Crenobacter cavernae]AXK39518.1 Fe-S protein assembly co-chaperone HscB [Crenobacter cavernae]